jgi:hypothetical protein
MRGELRAAEAKEAEQSQAATPGTPETAPGKEEADAGS